MARKVGLTSILVCLSSLSTVALADHPGSDLPRRPLGEASVSTSTALTAPRPLAASAVSHLLLPTSANVVGRFNAFFKTKVSIFNAVNARYDIRVGLSTRDGEISVTTITLSPGETRTFGNILDDLFGYTGGGAIDLDSGNSGNRFVVNAQVYVDTAGGRYTTAVQFAEDQGNISPSRPGYVVGISVDSFRRTNVGCASSSSVTQTITFQPFDKNFISAGDSFSFVLRPFGWDQFPLNGFLSNGVIKINSTATAVCYGVEVDNTTNDGTFQLATPF